MSFEPTAETLYNQTTYAFNFILSSSIWTISEYGFSLYNASGSIVGSTSASTNGGTLTVNYNVGNNTRMDAKGYYIVNGTTKYYSDSWNVMSSSDTQYSVSFLAQRISTYIDSGFFGLQKGAGLNLFCFIIILITIGSLSWKFSINEPTLIAVMTTVMVWFFEIGLGLITGMGNIPLTVWVGIPTVILIFKEGLKLI
jgi:hypothetical protein